MYLILAVCAVLPSTGCQLFLNAKHNLHNEPVQGCNNVSLTKQTIAYAKEAWAAYGGERPTSIEIIDFERGFIDGFADYLDRGGSGEPPAVPPLHYRRNRYLTPEGQVAVQHYFAGFAAGAQEAKGSGIRQTLLVQIALPPNAGGPTRPSDELAVPPTRIELPPPREVPPMPLELGPAPAPAPAPKAPEQPAPDLGGLILPPMPANEIKPEPPVVPKEIGPAPLLLQPKSPQAIEQQTRPLPTAPPPQPIREAPRPAPVNPASGLKPVPPPPGGSIIPPAPVMMGLPR
jgi:hypothetical protein